VLCYCAPVCMYYITVCLETRDQHWSLWTTGLPYTCYYWFVCQEGQQNVLKLFPNILFWRTQFSQFLNIIHDNNDRGKAHRVNDDTTHQITHDPCVHRLLSTDSACQKNTDYKAHRQNDTNLLSCNALSKQHSDEVRQFCNSNTETNKITFDHT